jgi:hypothetical protein
MWGKKRRAGPLLPIHAGISYSTGHGFIRDWERRRRRRRKKAQSKEAHARREPIISSSYPHRLLSLDRLASFLLPPFLPRISRWE